MIVPDAHDENTTASKRLTHTGKTTLGRERAGVTEDGLLLGAEVGGDRVGSSDTGDVALGVLNDNAVLDIQAADLGEGTGGSVVGGDELSDNGDLLGGIDGLAGAIEVGVAHTVGVEITTIFVAHTSITVVAITTGSTAAAGLASASARMRSIGSRDRVGFPDIHLSTASTVLADTGVGIVGRWVPSSNIGLQMEVSKKAFQGDME